MTPAAATDNSYRRAAAGYLAARVGLDLIGGVVIMAAVAAVSLTIYNSSRSDFMAGNNGRVMFAGLVASLSGYGVNSLFELVLGGSRQRLVEARVGALVEAVKEANARYAEARNDVPMNAVDRLAQLEPYRKALAKAERRAISAGAHYVDLV